MGHEFKVRVAELKRVPNTSFSVTLSLCYFHFTKQQYLLLLIITARQRSCGKVMFLHLSVILFTGEAEGSPLWIETDTTLDKKCPGLRSPSCTETPPLNRDPPRLDKDPLDRDPPGLKSRDGHWSGRYASYWNAYLFFFIVTMKEPWIHCDFNIPNSICLKGNSKILCFSFMNDIILWITFSLLTAFKFILPWLILSL